MGGPGLAFETWVFLAVASLLFEVDGNAGRNAKQVLVIAGKVRQAGISVISLDRAEGEMSSVLYVQPRAHQKGEGIRRGLNKSLLCRENAESKPWAKPANP